MVDENHEFKTGIWRTQDVIFSVAGYCKLLNYYVVMILSHIETSKSVFVMSWLIVIDVAGLCGLDISLQNGRLYVFTCHSQVTCN